MGNVLISILQKRKLRFRKVKMSSDAVLSDFRAHVFNLHAIQALCQLTSLVINNLLLYSVLHFSNILCIFVPLSHALVL